MTTFGIRIGEAFAGEGAEAAHVNVVIGDVSVLGPSFAQAIANQGPGHAPFVTVLRPSLPVRPLTLFVNKATIADERHGNLTWGSAQAGVAIGMTDAVATGTIPADIAGDLVAIAAVWVNPESEDAEKVFRNNVDSTRRAVAAAVNNEPVVGDVLRARLDCHNPFFDARPYLAADPMLPDRA
jgi:5,6,7,8-tetrahydromethanopterin hydro-lyase